MLNAANLVVNGAGLLASLTPLGPFNRTVTLYDQQKYLDNAAVVALQKGRVEKALVGLANDITNGAKIFQGIPFYRSSVLRYGIEERSRMCDHPIEDGSVISDHKLKDPITFSCALAMPEFLGGLVVDDLKTYYRESLKIIVQCATGVYMNMILAEMPTEITPDKASRPIFDLKFREVMIVSPRREGDAPEEGVASVSDSNTKKQTVFSDEITSNETMSQILGKFAAI